MATLPDTPASNPTRKLAAIMFSDISGYTAMMGRDEAAGLDARNSHRDLLRAILPRFNGRLIGDLGDGALSSFESAIEAVNCARTLLSATGSDRLMALHIGIHVGDVLFSENTVLGDGVNIASRIVALAPAGKICISDRVYEDVRNHRGIAATSLGQKHLKNVDRLIGVYVVDGSPGPATVAGRKPILSARRKAILGAAAALALAIAAIVYVVMTRSSSTVETAAPATTKPHPIRSIAVLPLDNYSGDPKQEYFSDGLTDELTTDLASISALRVISRGSVMQFKGAHRPPTPAIAKALNVDAVVEGSVMRVGEKVRITAQLIDAPDDKHLWAKSFERNSSDVLAMQDELASSIAKEINVQLTPNEQARLASARAVNPEAHDATLKGIYFLNRVTDENIKKAIAQFEEAIKLDPNFASAYAFLAIAYNVAADNEGVYAPAEMMPKEKAAAERAIQLDDNSADAHFALGEFKYAFEHDFVGSEREFRRAIELNPNSAVAHDQLGSMLAYQGRLDEALAEGQRAADLDPLNFWVLSDMVVTLTWQGKYEAAMHLARTFDLQWQMGWVDVQAGKISDAIPVFQKANVEQPSPLAAAWLGYAYGATGDRAQAMAMIEELNKKSPHGNAPPFLLAIVYLGMGDRARALDNLEKAYAGHSTWLTFLKMDRIFDPLRSEPRFIALMKKLNFEKEPSDLTQRSEKSTTGSPRASTPKT